MRLEHVYKNYNLGKKEIAVLKDINVEFKTNTFYAIMGRSGSGKTTLVNILGLLDNVTNGKYFLNDKDVTNVNSELKSKIISENIGFVFQSFYLNNNLSALENVMLPLYINKNVKKSERKELAKGMLAKFNLGNRINHKPKELSGGEQQRVAIARALINNPKIIIADEPTGNLDSQSEKEVFDILKKISKENKIVIVVSHNPIVKEYADCILEMEDGELNEIPRFN
ncbi:MAG: ABC transporter ATP-binding protein [Bacilli bacterium]|nr:ABC transporter ATP-binding protein [Bacilli bacterium]MCI6931865.1 ABC transporter ATP-binding protein [Mycoplasmatota bacterium]